MQHEKCRCARAPRHPNRIACGAWMSISSAGRDVPGAGLGGTPGRVQASGTKRLDLMTAIGAGASWHHLHARRGAGHGGTVRSVALPRARRTSPIAPPHTTAGHSPAKLYPMATCGPSGRHAAGRGQLAGRQPLPRGSVDTTQEWSGTCLCAFIHHLLSCQLPSVLQRRGGPWTGWREIPAGSFCSGA